MTLTETGDALVAVLTSPEESTSTYHSAVLHGEGNPVSVEADHELPANAGALLAIGVAPFDGSIPKILATALEQKLPVLGVGWGMHVVNVAMGGGMPVAVLEQPSEPTKMPVFISPGSKLSYTIAGSGWVSVPFSNTEGIRSAELAPGLMGSCYREDNFLAAVEAPGRNWVLGVQWSADEVDVMPSGFDSILLALVERAAGIQ